MDNKNFFRALFWALLIFLMWQMIAVRIWPPPQKPTPSTAPTSQPARVTETSPTSPEVFAAAAAAQPASKFKAVGADSAETVVLGDNTGHHESPYRSRIRFSSLGAAIETVHLSDHHQAINGEPRYCLLSPLEREGRTWRSLAVERVTIDSVPVSLDDVPWTVTRRELDGAQVAEFSVRLMGEAGPVIELLRTFTLPAQPAQSQRHDLQLTLTVRNLTTEQHEVIVCERGPIGLTSEGRFVPDQTVYAAARREGFIELETKNFKEIGKKGSFDLYSLDRQRDEPLVWFGGGNLYFTCTVCPVGADGATEPGYVATVEGVDLDGQKETADDVTTRLVARLLTLAPQAQQTLHAEVYLGPKDRDAFLCPDNSDYVDRNYMLQIKEGYGSCTFTFLTDLMIRLLNWLESVFHNFGVAIIFLVIIVRVILHPVTKKTQVNMVKMQQSMGPLQAKMEEIKKAHVGDNRRIQEETMKLYREAGVSPFGQVFTCLPMMLQMPIWIALYSSLRNNVAMRGRGFFWWIEDLTAPDCLIPFADPIVIPLLGWKVTCFNLLPLLVGVIMFAQQKLMPKPKRPASASSSPQTQQAEQMQKMMPYMSLLMILLFYKFPSGLNLYIMTSSLIGTAEQFYIRKHLKKQDEEGSQGPAPPPTPKKPRRRSTWFDRLQKRAEEAQRLRSHREHKEKRE